MKKIPIKNYVSALLIIIITILLTISLVNIYNKNNKIDFISEIKEEDLNQFIVETNNIFIYFSKANNKQLEQDLEKYLENNEIKNDMIYIDLNNITKDFEIKFNNQFNEVTSSVYCSIKNPALVYIQNSKIADCLNNIDNINDIKTFIKRNLND